MNQKTIGMLGGMGPEATLNCFAKILANTPANKDQEHIRVLIDNHPQIPDRTGAILGEGPSPGPAVAESCQALARAGADFIIIPCVTVHYFLDEFGPKSPLPIISILDVVTRAIKQGHPDFTRIGLMSTDGTRESGIFQKRLAAEGMETLTCAPQVQKEVMQAIYDLKGSQDPKVRASVTERFSTAAQTLVEAGAQGVIAGCTEIPLALGQENVSVPYFDSLTLLARAAIRAAGREPVQGAAQ
jgi:aspartate racemase